MENEFMEEFFLDIKDSSDYFARVLHHESYTDTVEVQYKKDMRERPIFAAYMAEHNIPSSIVFFNSIIEQALIKGTCFENDRSACLYGMLRNPSPLEHEVEVNIQLIGARGKILPELKRTTVKANHITNFEWYVLNKFIEFERIADADGPNYSIFLSDSSAELTLSRSFLPEVGVCINENGNTYHSTCDTYGSTFGVRDYYSHVFFISDLNKYAVVSYNDYCY
ncbi:hypothetical protein [Paenibacillus sp. Leaf72]|uniref:hypothetical protein n=1 Tax=Paenibacillus sp. Leaf72 TaxID=1736234 RepID=UPI0006F44741|nr:hypothetical protein [Paenibacillus sp. Leaf72]KQN96810.1 hypothetical protein ASF12_22315 [Paenibacillus sp. Leaf72]